jgi:predicted RNase H-like HicB family nuclease
MRRTSRNTRTSQPRAFDIVLVKEGGWWVATAPFLRGAYSQGRTRATAMANLVSAVDDLLASYRKDGEKPPFVSVRVEHTKLAAA